MASSKVMTDLEVRLTAQTADLKRKLGDAKKRVGGFTKQMQGLGNTIKGAFAVTAIVAMGKQLIQVGVEMSQMAGKAEGIKIAFDKLGVPLDSLRKATKGTVTDLELMRNTVKASEFGIPLENMSKLMEFAAIQAQKLGESSDTMLDSLIGSLSTQSKMRLDNLGISMSSMNKEMAKGKDFSQAAFTMINAKLSEGNGLLETSATKVARWGVMWENTKVSIGGLINKGLNAIAPVVDGILAASKSFFNWVHPKIVEFINGWIMLYNKSTVFRGAIELIKLAFKQTWITIKTYFKSMWSAIKGIGEILAFTFNPANWFEGDFLSKLGDKFTDAFKDIAGDVVDGAKELAKAYTDAVQNTLNGNPVKLLVVPTTKKDETSSTFTGKKTGGKAKSKKVDLDTSAYGVLSDEELDALIEQEDRARATLRSKMFELNEKAKAQKLKEGEELAATAETANQLIQETAARGLTSLGETIGQALAGAGSGMKTGLQSLLLILLEFAGSFGKMLVSLGIAGMALKKLIINPFTAIVAGVALIALAGAGKAMVQKSLDKTTGKKGFANGGVVNQGGLYTVGERGKETVALPTGSRVMSSAATKNAMNGGGFGNLHITGEFIATGENLSFVIDEYKRKQGNSL